MATINRSTEAAAPQTHEGGVAKRIGGEAQLRRSVMACLLWEDTFYESGESIADRIRYGVAAVPQRTAAEIAIEARERMHLRHVPLLVVREMARHGGRIVGDTLARIIQRADELTEFLAIYWKDGKQPLSAQVKRGLATAFQAFDAYQLAKYDRANEIRLRDVLFLTHPKPLDEEQAALWAKLAEGTLESPDTWEVALSGGGDKLEHWNRLLSEKRLGGLALLRNLRNMTEAGVERAAIREAINGHPFPRVLPFRFIAAAQHAPQFEPELEQAMYRAAGTLEKLPGKTALVVDCSASMGGALSRRGTMTRFDAAGGLAIMLREICDDVDVVAFGSEAARVPPRRGFALRDAIRDANVGHSTYASKGVELAGQGGYDRVIVVSDEQVHGRLQDPLPGATGYVVNVAVYENGVGYGRWTHMDGWSENVVRYIAEAEQRDEPR